MNNSLNLFKKVIIRFAVAMVFFILDLTAMICIMSAIVYKDNRAFVIGAVILAVTVPMFAVVTWKEVNEYVEKIW